MACYTKHRMRATASCMIPAVSRSLFALISALLMFHCVSVAPTCASFLQEQPTTTTTAATSTTTRTTTTSASVVDAQGSAGTSSSSFGVANGFLTSSAYDKNDENWISFGLSLNDTGDLLGAQEGPSTTTVAARIASDLTTVVASDGNDGGQQVSSQEGGIGALLKQYFSNGEDTANVESTTTSESLFFDALSDHNIESEESRGGSSTTSSGTGTSAIETGEAAKDIKDEGDAVAVTTKAAEVNDADEVIIDSAADSAYQVFLAPAAAEAASAEQDDPQFDWDTSLPGAATSCFFTGLPVRADNGVILRFSGAAVRMANANYPFRALHECGVITDSSECGDYVLSDTDSTKPCIWQTNSLSLGSKYGTASCSSVPTTTLELTVGTSTWFNALERYEANGYLNVSDEQIFMREEELGDCLQYTAEGPDVCNSKTDSRGHQCTMCEKIPYDYYPFLEAPMDPDDSNYIRLCLADYTFPTFCNMFKQITTMCSSGEYWEPTYDTTSTTTTTITTTTSVVTPDATTIAATVTTNPDATTVAATVTTSPDATTVAATVTTTMDGSDSSTTITTTTTTTEENSDAASSSKPAATTPRSSTVTLSRNAGKAAVGDGNWLLNASATAAVLLATLI